jgi:hypothetical protein
MFRCIHTPCDAIFLDLVIKYDKYSDLIPSVSKYLKHDLLADGKASVVWMLGEFGEVMLRILELNLLSMLQRVTEPIKVVDDIDNVCHFRRIFLMLRTFWNLLSMT